MASCPCPVMLRHVLQTVHLDYIENSRREQSRGFKRHFKRENSLSLTVSKTFPR